MGKGQTGYLLSENVSGRINPNVDTYDPMLKLSELWILSTRSIRIRHNQRIAFISCLSGFIQRKGIGKREEYDLRFRKRFLPLKLFSQQRTRLLCGSRLGRIGDGEEDIEIWFNVGRDDIRYNT